ncbi:PREDICTED: uncharacterized protein LOC101382411 [Odobenus rosmarus divergens]|uniref:Uncharacterized protein LOC101382411 n=1 Tax=Odobenus rosmarus divergens TaxID=9708 RepID=A0A9B0M5A9_ODORO
MDSELREIEKEVTAFSERPLSSLRPLSGCSYPFSGLSSGSCRPVFRGRLGAPVFSRELLNRHRGPLHAFRPVCDFRLSSSELRSWSHPFTLKFRLGHSLFSGGLLFLFNLFRISVEVEIRRDLPRVFSGNGATHAQNFPGEHPPHQTL